MRYFNAKAQYCSHRLVATCVESAAVQCAAFVGTHDLECPSTLDAIPHGDRTRSASPI